MIAAIAAISLAVPAAADAACKNRYASPSVTSAAKIKRATLCLLNHERTKRRRHELHGNKRLARAARNHAADMVKRDYFSHTTPGGVSFVDRIMRQDYVKPSQGWALGENLAWGSYTLATPKAIVRSWMHSPGHRANILNRGFREIGIGVVRGAPVSGFDHAATYATSFGTRF